MRLVTFISISLTLLFTSSLSLGAPTPSPADSDSTDPIQLEEDQGPHRSELPRLFGRLDTRRRVIAWKILTRPPGSESNRLRDGSGAKGNAGKGGAGGQLEVTGQEGGLETAGKPSSEPLADI